MLRPRARRLLAPAASWAVSGLAVVALLRGTWTPGTGWHRLAAFVSLGALAAATRTAYLARDAAWRPPRRAGALAALLLGPSLALVAATGGLRSPALPVAACCALVALHRRRPAATIAAAAALALLAAWTTAADSARPPLDAWAIGAWLIAGVLVVPHAALAAATGRLQRERRRHERLGGLLGERGRTPAGVPALAQGGSTGVGVRAHAPRRAASAPASVCLTRYLDDVRDWAGGAEAVLWRLDETGGGVVALAWSGGGEAPRHHRDEWLPAVAWTMSEGLSQLHPSPETPRLCVAPVALPGGAAGALTVAGEEALTVRSRDETTRWLGRFAEHLAALAALVEERDEVSRRNRHATALLLATRDFPTQHTAERLAESLFAAAFAITGVPRAALVRWRADEGRGDVEFRTAGHPLASPVLVTATSYVGATCAGGRPLVWEDATTLDSGTPVYGGGEPSRRLGALAVIPYYSSGEVRGALVVEGELAGDLRTEDRRALRQLVDLAAASLERLARTEAETLRATTDKLTGLKNRRYFDEQFARESARVFRMGSSLAVVVGDVDHFKRINDGHGHDAGDAVLRAVATRFGQAVRDVDLPARFGGEEFVVLLPDTGLDGAMVMAERLRRSIAARPVTAGGMDIPVTMSFGVAAFPASTPNREALFGAADRALYRAKSEGRNCVRPATPRDSQTRA